MILRPITSHRIEGDQISLFHNPELSRSNGLNFSATVINDLNRDFG